MNNDKIAAAVSTKLRSTWYNMHQRCFNKNSSAFKYYGGKGITVCKTWSDFKNFKMWAIANDFAAGSVLERIRNNSDYKPSNCHWVPRPLKQLNYKGKTQCISDWADELGINYGTLRKRLSKGWPTKKAFEKPVAAPRGKYF